MHQRRVGSTHQSVTTSGGKTARYQVHSAASASRASSTTSQARGPCRQPRSCSAQLGGSSEPTNIWAACRKNVLRQPARKVEQGLLGQAAGRGTGGR